MNTYKVVVDGVEEIVSASDDELAFYSAQSIPEHRVNKIPDAYNLEGAIAYLAHPQEVDVASMVVTIEEVVVPAPAAPADPAQP